MEMVKTIKKISTNNSICNNHQEKTEALYTHISDDMHSTELEREKSCQCVKCVSINRCIDLPVLRFFLHRYYHFFYYLTSHRFVACKEISSKAIIIQNFNNLKI